MPNIAQVLKEEIQRLAKKEVKAATTPIQKTTASLRRSVADLKRRLSVVERENKQLLKQAKKTMAKVSDDEVEEARITAKMIKSMRSRLGVSQAKLALLLDVSSISVAKWEQKEGRLVFRGDTKARIVAVRKLSKAEVQERLEKM